MKEKVERLEEVLKDILRKHDRAPQELAPVFPGAIFITGNRNIINIESQGCKVREGQKEE